MRKNRWANEKAACLFADIENLLRCGLAVLTRRGVGVSVLWLLSLECKQSERGGEGLLDMRWYLYLSAALSLAI